MTALLELGAFVGAIIAGFVADKWSRKFSIGELHSDLPVFLHSVLIA